MNVRWYDNDSDIGYWNLLVNDRIAVVAHDIGDGYKLTSHAGQFVANTNIPVMSVEEMKRAAESWYIARLQARLDMLNKEAELCQEQLASLTEVEKLVDIGAFEYEDGYLHFRVTADGYSLEGLFRLYDPENGPDMSLVSIDYGYLHPIIERQWDRIEMALYDIAWKRYHDILDKSEAFKDKVLAAMEAAGYTYDVLESHEGWHRFFGEGGVSMGFDRLYEAKEWLDGVVFDEPEVAKTVEEIMIGPFSVREVDDVIADAEVKAGQPTGNAIENQLDL